MKDKHSEENDYCDLDPTKLCDNCCRCIDERSEVDYSVIMAKLDPEGTRIFHKDDPDVMEEGLPPLPGIDPALMAEWEEKLRVLEEEEARNAPLADEEDEEEYEAPRELTLKGARKKRAHISHLHEA